MTFERFEIKVAGKALKHQPLSMATVMDTVSAVTNIPVDMIKAKGKVGDVCFARQLFMVLCKRYTMASLNTIGRYVGRTHATVLHAEKTILNLIETEAKTRTIFEHIEYKLRLEVGKLEAKENERIKRAKQYLLGIEPPMSESIAS